MLSFLAASLIAFSPTQPASLPIVSISTFDEGIEIISSDGVETERFIVWGGSFMADPISFDDCVDGATIACGSQGIKWLRYRTNPTTGEVTCEFECNGTGSGGG